MTRAPAVAAAQRATSATPSTPRTRRRFAVVGTGTSVEPRATNGAAIRPSASATSRRPSLSASTAVRMLPSYAAIAVTRSDGR
jgi:hypothetical protein